MFTRHRVHIRRAEQPVGIRPVVHSVLAVIATPQAGWTFSKEPRPSEDGRGINISGVDFWHTVEFSRNGRFLWTLLTRSSGRFPSVFQTLSGFLGLPDHHSPRAPRSVRAVV